MEETRLILQVSFQDGAAATVAFTARSAFSLPCDLDLA
jgi:hypothetical protein